VSRRRPLALILVVAFVAVVTGVVWFTGRAQPEAVDIERALAGTASMVAFCRYTFCPSVGVMVVTSDRLTGLTAFAVHRSIRRSDQ
jgi:hypothetical protein